MKVNFTHALSTGLVMPRAYKKGFLTPGAAALMATEEKAAESPNANYQDQAKPTGAAI